MVSQKRARPSLLDEAFTAYRESTGTPKFQTSKVRSPRSREKIFKLPASNIPPKPEAGPEQFRFLDLPPELRNHIYRLLLVTKHVSKRVPNPDYENNAEESEPILYTGSPARHLATGTIRSYSLWKYTLEFQLQILRVNRQVYGEASGIFEHENGWVVVNANKTGFGQDLKDHGYGVVYQDCYSYKPIHQIFKNPVLTMTLTLGPPPSGHSTETFVLTTAGISQFARALWTCQNPHNLRIFYDTSPNHASHPAAAPKVIKALSRLWKLSILAPHLPAHTPRIIHLPNTLHKPPLTATSTPRELAHALALIRHRRRTSADNVHKPIRSCASALAFLADSYKLHSAARLHTTLASTRALAFATASIALLLAELNLARRDFRAVVKYTTYALTLSKVRFGVPAVARSAPGILRLGGGERARVLVMRGQALGELGRGGEAGADYEVAMRLLGGGGAEDGGAVRGLRELRISGVGRGE